MSLRYLNEAEAEKLCQSTLTEWISTAGYKGCHSGEKTREAVEDAKLWATKSKTAREVMSYVETSGKEILVVGMRGGYQCFDSTGTDQMKKVPVVYIDLDGRLTNFVRQPHQLHFAPEDCKDLGVSSVAMDNRVALLHEFGHAKQWIERPTFFDGHFVKQQGKPVTADIVLQKKVDDGDPLLNPKGIFAPVHKKLAGGGTIGESFSEAIRNRAAQVLGEKAKIVYDPLVHPEGFFPTQEEIDAFKPVTGYSVHIEADNIAKHEWPICDELGIPRRVNYRDISGKSTATASQTSTLLKRQSQAQKKDQPKVASMTKSECPKCHKMVLTSAVSLPCMFHK
jgi:hypothetical protein